MASLFWSIWLMMRSLAEYITHMARDGTYGDQITLYTAANLYNIDIQIVSAQSWWAACVQSVSKCFSSYRVP